MYMKGLKVIKLHFISQFRLKEHMLMGGAYYVNWRAGKGQRSHCLPSLLHCMKLGR